MKDHIKELTEEIAYDFIVANCPRLLRSIRIFLAAGLSPTQIVDVCADKTKQPRHKVEFIGCAADYLFRRTRQNKFN